MPLRPGTSRRVIGRNIAAEVRSGRPTRQAIAIAFAEARKMAGRHIISESKGTGYRITLTESDLLGKPYYEVVWRKPGLKRAHRRHDGRSRRRADAAFARFVREAQS